MLFLTHIAFGALLGLYSMQVLEPRNQILFFMIVIFASALPDIDSTRSKMGQKVKIVGWLFEHRGFFHSLIALALLSFLFFLLTNSPIYSYAFIIGYTSHLIIDSITLEGTGPLHPLLKFRLRGLVKTGGLIEIIILVVLVILDVIKLIRF